MRACGPGRAFHSARSRSRRRHSDATRSDAFAAAAPPALCPACLGLWLAALAQARPSAWLLAPGRGAAGLLARQRLAQLGDALLKASAFRVLGAADLATLDGPASLQRRCDAALSNRLLSLHADTLLAHALSASPYGSASAHGRATAVEAAAALVYESGRREAVDALAAVMLHAAAAAEEEKAVRDGGVASAGASDARRTALAASEWVLRAVARRCDAEAKAEASASGPGQALAAVGDGVASASAAAAATTAAAAAARAGAALRAASVPARERPGRALAANGGCRAASRLQARLREALAGSGC